MSIFKKKINDKIIIVLFSILIMIVLYLNLTFEKYASQIEKQLLIERNKILTIK